MATLQTDQSGLVAAELVRAGYARVEPAVLQPVEVFLELSGEDIRRRLFVTQDAQGRELCLRPEYTIPVSRDYLAGPEAGRQAAFAYAGPVFRHRGAEAGEFPQAGVESFGRADRAEAEADVLALALSTSASLGLTRPSVRVGDLGLTQAVLDALDVPMPARRRLLRALVKGEGARAVAGLTAGSGDAAESADYAGLLNALSGLDAKAAKAIVEDVLSIAGIAQVGGRTASEIAQRFLDRAGRRETGIATDAAAILGRYLEIEGTPSAAAAALRALARDTNLPVGPALDAFEARIGALRSRGIDEGGLAFATAFARNLDYYTGFVFEILDPARDDGRPLGGGGRYDALLSRLGAAQPIPAVGFSLWLDRFAGGPA